MKNVADHAHIQPPPHITSYNITATTTCARRVSALVGYGTSISSLKTHGAAAPTRNTCSFQSLLCYQYIVAIASNSV